MSGLEQMKPVNLNVIVIHAQNQLIKNPNPQLLNPLLGLLKNSQDAFFLYNQMLSHPFSHNHYTFTHALKACSSLHARSKGLEIHAHLIKSGHYVDLFIQNSLLHFYCHVGNDVVSASRVFESIPSPDVVSWTSMVSGLSKCGFEAEAIRKFSAMDVKPNAATLVSALSACSGLKALGFGKAVHAYGLKSMIDGNVIFDNAVLDLYAKCGSLVNAENLFVKMSKRDVISWTTLVMAYAQGGHCEEAIAVFKRMVLEGEAEPNEATVVTVLSACASMGALSLGQWVHSYIDTRCDLVLDGNIGNALLNMYAKCGDMQMGFRIFNMLVHKDVITWGTVICGLAMNGHGKQAVQIFSHMLIQGVPPDDVTFIGLLSACSHAGLVNEGIMFFKAMRDTYCIAPQMRHYGCMIDMYGRAGLFEEAEAFLRGMPVEAEGPIWGALLQACKIHGNENMSEWIRGHVNNKNVGIGTLALLSNLYASSERWDDANKVRNTMRGVGLRKLAGCSWIELDMSTNRLDSNLCVA
ncbi:pentatricopeptide repeat-containing protein At1g08070, chloroplastic-like [Gastrolobium bilobum]|uniref:pentatricopeptide repeat-containing protein At1g08070, chloroplastic-like n=1 Tax=Gastrolobium bilobum TaxID=150636 RepID=UPI002AAFF3FD|nr:pentatricopeptide repeat-containing protein At1g08070, chloroplastic-like [Gastrolobium bilobum]